MEHNKKRKIVIAIDGHSSCGKSTFAKAIAARLGYIFIDTGAMYRSVTLYALEHGAICNGIVNEDAVIALLDDITITFRFNPMRGASDIYVNGDLVEGKIRTIEVSNFVSAVSSIAQVREKLVAMQQQMGASRGVVMDGRDIGTVVFPDAELKIFMTAEPKVRAERRYAELTAKGDKVCFEEILENVISRASRMLSIHFPMKELIKNILYYTPSTALALIILKESNAHYMQNIIITGVIFLVNMTIVIYYTQPHLITALTDKIAKRR